jgi:MFS family permease
MALCLVLLTAVRTFPVAIVWSFFIGLLIGGLFNTLYQVTLADYFGRQSLGKINGAVWPVQMVANAFGPLIAAMAYDGIGSYDLVFVLFGGLVFGCAGLVFFARPPRRPALVPND